ncbi:MAG: serine hydrolase, partial [Acidobacteriota bacterium]
MTGRFNPALLWMLLALVGCSTPGGPAEEPSLQANLEALRSELADLRSQLAMPGIAFAVVRDGQVLEQGAFGSLASDSSQPFTPATPLDFMSVTKSMVAVIALQLAGEGKLDIEAPVLKYLPDMQLPQEVKVRHLLSHTSEGVVGREYVYGSGRYGLLKQVIESVSAEPFQDVFRRRIIESAGMDWHDSPYLGAASGLVSTVADMARYARALDRGDLLDDKSLQRLARPSKSIEGRALPVSLGWFAQSIQGVPVMWSYGQDDFSALLFRVPDRKLTLVLLANSDAMSNAFRLMMGDARRSPFAMAFYRLFVASPIGRPLIRPDWAAPGIQSELAALEEATEYRYQDELIGQALIELWNGQPDRAESLLEAAMDRYGTAAHPDPVIHFAAQQFPAGRVRQMGLEMGSKLLAAYPGNRWMLHSQANLLRMAGEKDQAILLLHRTLDLPNQNDEFVHRIVQTMCWSTLAQIHRQDDPDQARRY